MKKVILIILEAVVGVALLLGGGVFGAIMYNASVPHFDNYQIASGMLANLGDGASSAAQTAQELRDMQQAEGYGVSFPNFSYINPYTPAIFACYEEVDGACHDYAYFVAHRYNNKAKLDAEVEYTPELLTIKFTGYGVLEDGTEECLDRTYIFDIDGVGKNKLPKLLNKADIFPEI